jgi:hypothetical protein
MCFGHHRTACRRGMRHPERGVAVGPLRASLQRVPEDSDLRDKPCVRTRPRPYLKQTGLLEL